MDQEKLDEVKKSVEQFKQEVHNVIVGYDEVIEGLLISLLAKGHVILEGVPGLAKTLLAKSFAASASCQFSRIQFTPDLVPSDVTGTNIFDQKSGTFSFRRGPVFTQILLADEINRAPPRTQSALLQCMQEREVTIDDTTHSLPEPFFVIATQNPIEMEGVYPLPEAQLDRFLFKLIMRYPEPGDEKSMIRKYASGEKSETKKAITDELILDLQSHVHRVKLDSKILDYVHEIVQRTRGDERIMLGASPRAALYLTVSAQARAMVRGRDYVTPSDVKAVAPDVLRHRLILRPEAELGGLTVGHLIQEVLEAVQIPSLV